jgi:hypothetical protein
MKMNKAELYLARRKQEKASWSVFITAILQMTASASIACYIYFVRKKTGDIGLFFGLVDIGRGLLARYRLKKIQEERIILEVMED